MTAYYNEHDKFAAAWLRELIQDGLIAPGDVDERDIQDVTPADLVGYRQCHFFAAPDGQTTSPSGPAHAHANLSARQAKAAGLLTSGTSGRHSTGSSASVALQSLLANKLAAQTVSLGSTLYSLTWIKRATPAGRSIPALRASERRISGSGFTGWATPSARDNKDTSDPEMWNCTEERERHDQLP
jgi:hypothetical protein